MARRPAIGHQPPGVLDRPPAGDRLGIDQPVGWWPTAPRLKAYEAAGFAIVQVRMPPRAVLGDSDLLIGHASALAERLRLTGLRLVLHAPDDLLAGSREHDRQLDGALLYASVAGAELVVYHGARVLAGSADRDVRLGRERTSLRRRIGRCEQLEVRLAVENLAPVYGGPPFVCHDPFAVAELVRALDSPQVGMCLDLGHAHITGGLTGVALGEMIEPLLDDVILFHVHDNFGGRRAAERAGGIEPVRLDLHLAPGAGSLPWRTLAPALAAHRAPLQLEVHPSHRPEPERLVVVMQELLGLSAARTP